MISLIVVLLTRSLIIPFLFLSFNFDLVKFEKFLFKLTNIFEKHVEISKVDFALLCEVAIK